jgi:hypothetical protein
MGKYGAMKLLTPLLIEHIFKFKKMGIFFGDKMIEIQHLQLLFERRNIVFLLILQKLTLLDLIEQFYIEQRKQG